MALIKAIGKLLFEQIETYLIIINNYFVKCFNRPKTNLGQFQMAITKQEVYKENDPLVDGVIKDMTNLPILKVCKFFV